MGGKHKNLRRILILFLALYLVNLVLPLLGIDSHTRRMWLASSAIIGLLSLLVLLKEGMPGRTSLFLGLMLAFLVGYTQPFTGVITFFAFQASIRMMERAEERVPVLRRPYRRSILLGVGLGVILGFINLFLAGAELEFRPTVFALILSLNPGISEEIIFRLFIYAFSVYLLGGRITTRREGLWVYVLMIVPHVLLHFPDMYFVEGTLRFDLGTLLVGPLILSLFFGLPMALAMRKRDLTSAMLVHTTVDYIRFIFIGLPF